MVTLTMMPDPEVVEVGKQLLTQLTSSYQQNPYEFGEADLAVRELVERCVKANHDDFCVVVGMVGVPGEEHPQPHVWIEKDGTVYDPAVSQFHVAPETIQYNPPGEYSESYTPREYLDAMKAA